MTIRLLPNIIAQVSMRDNDALRKFISMLNKNYDIDAVLPAFRTLAGQAIFSESVDVERFFLIVKELHEKWPGPDWSRELIHHTLLQDEIREHADRIVRLIGRLLDAKDKDGMSVVYFIFRVMLPGACVSEEVGSKIRELLTARPSIARALLKNLELESLAVSGSVYDNLFSLFPVTTITSGFMNFYRQNAGALAFFLKEDLINEKIVGVLQEMDRKEFLESGMALLVERKFLESDEKEKDTVRATVFKALSEKYGEIVSVTPLQSPVDDMLFLMALDALEKPRNMERLIHCFLGIFNGKYILTLFPKIVETLFNAPEVAIEYGSQLCRHVEDSLSKLHKRDEVVLGFNAKMDEIPFPDPLNIDFFFSIIPERFQLAFLTKQWLDDDELLRVDFVTALGWDALDKRIIDLLEKDGVKDRYIVEVVEALAKEYVDPAGWIQQVNTLCLSRQQKDMCHAIYMAREGVSEEMVKMILEQISEPTTRESLERLWKGCDHVGSADSTKRYLQFLKCLEGQKLTEAMEIVTRGSSIYMKHRAAMTILAKLLSDEAMRKSCNFDEVHAFFEEHASLLKTDYALMFMDIFIHMSYNGAEFSKETFLSVVPKPLLKSLMKIFTQECLINILEDCFGEEFYLEEALLGLLDTCTLERIKAEKKRRDV